MTALDTAERVHDWHAGQPITLADPDDLNELAEFDLPFEVLADGRIRMVRDVFAPEAFTDLDADGSEVPGTEQRWTDTLRSQGWEPVTGYSGQYGYAGPHMHESESLGAGMARDVLATPGVYVCIVVTGLRDLDEAEYTDEARESDWGYAWALLRRIGGDR